MRSAQPWRTTRSRVLRSKPISAEAALWRRLRNRQLGGFKFVRQFPIGPYFADFTCRELRLIVELDGGTHSEAQERASDAERSRVLNTAGFRVVRVRNADVYGNIEGVLDTILAELVKSDLAAGDIHAHIERSH
ncbi:MAG: endonuclease domain-containing protein [Hyphomicrobiales bacterium]|nr:MAG: endonuclease domain-containing protein [Hyphomicrobiales bacterium]